MKMGQTDMSKEVLTRVRPSLLGSDGSSFEGSSSTGGSSEFSGSSRSFCSKKVSGKVSGNMARSGSTLSTYLKCDGEVRKHLLQSVLSVDELVLECHLFAFTNNYNLSCRARQIPFPTPLKYHQSSVLSLNPFFNQILRKELGT